MSSRTGEVVTPPAGSDEFKKAIEMLAASQLDDDCWRTPLIILKVKIGGDVISDINDAVSLTWNTGSYLVICSRPVKRRTKTNQDCCA